MEENNTNAAEMEAILSIPVNQIKSPTLPVDIFVQEADELYKWCLPDKPRLLAKGLDETLIDSLPMRTKICRESQTAWASESNLQKDALRAWQSVLPEAINLRREIVGEFRYAFRKDDELLKKLSTINRGLKYTDLIEELGVLSELGKKNQFLLDAINFDSTLLETAVATSETLAVLLTQSNNEKKLDNDTLIFRNKAYSYLKIAVDEIRACGRVVFKKEKSRLKGYKSNFILKRYMKSVANKEDKQQVNSTLK